MSACDAVTVNININVCCGCCGGPGRGPGEVREGSGRVPGGVCEASVFVIFGSFGGRRRAHKCRLAEAGGVAAPDGTPPSSWGVGHPLLNELGRKGVGYIFLRGGSNYGPLLTAKLK